MKKYFTSLFVITLLVTSQTLTYAQSVNPTQDTDGDGIPDVQEDSNGNTLQDAGETDAFNADTDRGGESDGTEKAANRNPLDQTDDLTFDADQDGWVNSIELIRGSDPKKADSDDDGVADSKDPFPLDSKYTKDENSNGLPDEWEAEMKLSKEITPQTRADDPDNDGLTNAEELAKGTNPLQADSDKDGTNDFHEVFEGTDPKENACLALGEGEDFPDTIHHWAKHAIHTGRRIIIRQGTLPLIQGRTSKKGLFFEPNAPITRYEFLKIALLSSCIPLLSDQALVVVVIPDVPKVKIDGEPLDLAMKRTILYTAKARKIVEGYPDGTLRPDQPITRAEAVKILLRAHGISHTEESKTTFSDIPSSAWFVQDMNTAIEREILRGYSDGTIKPENPISRAEAITIVLRTVRQNPLINGYILPEEE